MQGSEEDSQFGRRACELVGACIATVMIAVFAVLAIPGMLASLAVMGLMAVIVALAIWLPKELRRRDREQGGDQ